jgi:hypothetical protein
VEESAASDRIESEAMDDRERRLLAPFSREALKNMEAAIVHIRGCKRCERVFTIAYEAHVEGRARGVGNRAGYGRRL